MPESRVAVNRISASDRAEEGVVSRMRAVSYTFPKRMYLLSSACVLYSASDRSDMLLKVVCSDKKQSFYSASGKTEAEILFNRDEAEIFFSDGVEILRFANGAVAFGADSAYEAVYTCSGREYPIILKKGKVIAEFFPIPEDKNACKALVASPDEVAEATAVYCALERLRDADTRL